MLGCAAGAWAPLVPFAKARLGLDDGGLGVLLLCLGAGSIAAVSMLGYAGILAGPAGIGFIARAAGLPVALMAVAGLLLIVAAGAPRLPG